MILDTKGFAEKMAKEQEEAAEQKRLDTKVKLLKEGLIGTINTGVLAGVVGRIVETNPCTTTLRTSDGSEISTSSLSVNQKYKVKDLALGMNDIVVEVDQGSTNVKFVEGVDKDSILLVGGGDELYLRDLNDPFGDKEDIGLAVGDFVDLANKYRLLCKAEDRQDAETFVHTPRKHQIVSYED